MCGDTHRLLFLMTLFSGLCKWKPLFQDLADIHVAASLSQKCIAMCMDRYMDSWNTVSKTYNSRLQRERARM